MADYETLPHAPLTEALIDFGVSVDPRIDLDTLAAFGELIAAEYPNRLVVRSMEAHISLGEAGVDPGATSTTVEPTGYRFQNAAASQVVLARTDGLTVSRLKPYKDWPSLRDEARRLWEIFVGLTGVESVTRTSVRYINRLELPLPLRDFKDFILTVPEVGPSLPQELPRFFMQLVIPFDEIQGYAIVNQTILTDAATSDRLPLIFDIEVNRQGAIDASSAVLWSQLEELRTVKNRVFFGSVTPRCLEMFR